MKTLSDRVDRLVLVPVGGALVVMWLTLLAFTVVEHRIDLERVQTQLGMTVSTLADFDELAEQSKGVESLSTGGRRSAAIWRALLQYPSASIWVDTLGIVSGGARPAGDLGDFIVVEDARANFTVHAALPRADALEEWRRSLWQRGAALLSVSLGALLLARFLMRALRQRAAAQGAAAASEERVTQLALYKSQLERTVDERTGELQQANSTMQKELVDRKAAESALREHDALLNVVTKSAAELLGTQHEDAVLQVLDMIGHTVAVSRVQLCQFSTDALGHLHSSIRQEWCAPGTLTMIDNPKLQNLDLTLSLPRSATPTLVGTVASFYVDELSAPYAAQFEQVGMRSFLQIPLVVQDKLWGSLNFIDSSKTPRHWSWAESDTLQTLAGLIGVAITRAQYVKELADANMIVQNSPTILYRLRGEPSFPLIYISHNITKFGHDPEKLIGSGDWATTLIDPADRAKVVEAMTRALAKDAQPASIEFRLRTGSGGYRWVENHYTPVREKKDGRLIEVEGIVIDITERKAAEEKIALLARTDALTGLANRATFIDRLDQAFSASRRGASPFATLYIDLDRFKQVNDTLGHPVGDLLLRQVAERLKGSCREGDVVARLGGDEFAILQMDVLDPANAGTLAAKIQRALAAPYLISGSEINYITASVGISPYSSSSTGPDVMLVQADRALYRSKEEGRNQFRFYSEDLDRQVRERVALAAELRQALDRTELELSYEPQVDVASGEVVRVEALVRWKHPKRGLIETEEFLPIAERAGLMPAIGTWVLDQACRQMKSWRDTGTKCSIIAIGLSLSQVKNGRELMRAVVQSTTRWNIQPRELEFDVTEATLAHATVMQNDVLSQLQLLGARIAIDKFGTEYSSFDYVRAYRVSHVKLAKSFLEGAATDAERAATVRAIFNIAHELDIGIVAAAADSLRHRALVQVAS